jgi:hypothetical protein
MEHPAEHVQAIYATAIAKSSDPSRSAKSVPVSSITPGDRQHDSLLNIENQSDQKTKFYVIREPPVFKANKAPDKVYVVVYQATNNVKETIGRAQFRLKGTTPGKWSMYEIHMRHTLTSYLHPCRCSRPLDLDGYWLRL